MAQWGPFRSIMVGGVVAVGFVDERCIVVGSHNGLGVFDVGSGELIGRVPDHDGGYTWYRDDPPAAVYMDCEGEHIVQVAGLWGGALTEVTSDGWVCRSGPTGATLSGPDGTVITVDDDEEPRASGFSPEGRVFVFATSPTLHVAVRSSD